MKEARESFAASLAGATSEPADTPDPIQTGVIPTPLQPRPLSFASLAIQQIERQTIMLDSLRARVETGLLKSTRIEMILEQNMTSLLVALCFIGFLLLVVAFELGGLLIALMHVLGGGFGG